MFKFLVLSVFVACFSITLFAQPCPPGEWPPDEHSTSCWIGEYPTTTIHFDIKFKKRVVGNVKQIYITDYGPILGNAQYLDELKIEQWDWNAFQNFVDIHLLEYLWMHAYFTDLANIPNCEQGEISVVQFYTAACGVWVKCSYKIDPATRICDEGYIPPYPDYSYQGDTWVSVSKYQPCGEVCCKRTYYICRGQSQDPHKPGGSDIMKIRKGTVEPDENSVCDGEMNGQTPAFRKWEDDSKINCVNGCR